MTSFDLERTYLFLDGKGLVESAEGGSAFWASVGEKPQAGETMVIVDEDEGDWPRWEMHPRGDEILVILEGAPLIFLEHADGRLERRATRPGETLIVPRGTWHRAEGAGARKILFITYGPGTTHRNVSEDDRAKAAALA